jgi:hypothetical protein
MTVAVKPDRLGCPPPAPGAIAQAAGAALTGANRPPNGQDITLHLLRTAVSNAYPNVEVISATVSRQPAGTIAAVPFAIDFLQIADIDITQITAALA